jgi:purine-nucleoside phosphorylase
MKKVTVFETVHEHAAGIDIGAEKIFVSPDGAAVVSFDTFTSGYYQCIEYLQQKGIIEVAVEATGVYWIALYTMLESCGFKVAGQIFKEIAQSLINSKHIAVGSFIRKIKARKDAAIAIKAGARKLALAYYDTLTKGNDYAEQGIKKYEEQIAKKEKAALYKLAKKYNVEIVDKQIVA